MIPTVLEQTHRGERAFDLYSQLLRERIIFVGAAIDDQVANLVVAQLLHLEAADPLKPVNLYINSPGGDVTAGFAIYDTMQAIRAPVATFCVGQAASWAAVLLAGGAPGRRTTLPNARILIHQPHGRAGGQTSDIKIQFEEMAHARRRIEELLAHHTGQSQERIGADIERDFILRGAEAVAYGLVDTVLAPSAALPDAAAA